MAASDFLTRSTASFLISSSPPMADATPASSANTPGATTREESAHRETPTLPRPSSTSGAAVVILVVERRGRKGEEDGCALYSASPLHTRTGPHLAARGPPLCSRAPVNFWDSGWLGRGAHVSVGRGVGGRWRFDSWRGRGKRGCGTRAHGAVDVSHLGWCVVVGPTPHHGRDNGFSGFGCVQCVCGFLTPWGTVRVVPGVSRVVRFILQAGPSDGCGSCGSRTNEAS